MTPISTAAHATIARLSDFSSQVVTLRGWLYSKRSSGKLQFLQLRDGTGLVQVIVSKKDVDEASWSAGDQATQESSLIVSGLVHQDARAPHCGFEIHAKQVELVQQAALDYPISPKEHGIDFLMQNRHLWLRTPRQAAIMRIRHEVIAAAQDFLNQLDFVRVDAPIFTPNACEGTTTLFEVDYFDDKAYLSQSGQLYEEAAAMALGKVYCFGPAFRAEKSKTRRHLTEFWMIEPEVAFQTFDENLELQEGFVSHIVQRVLSRRQAELAVLERDVSKLENVKPPFPRLSYDEAVDILKAEGHDFEWGGDFGSPDETLLASRFDRPVFVHRFPAKIKAFYMAPDPERPEVALGADLLAPEGYGEIIGGGQRLADHDELLKRVNEHQLPLEQFQWYLDLRKFGSVPHGGFGMGIERCVAWICGVEHIREVIPFPRTIYRIYP